MGFLNSEIILTLLKYGYNSLFVGVLFTIVVHRDRMVSANASKYFRALAYLLLNIIVLSGFDVYFIYSKFNIWRSAHIAVIYLRYILAPVAPLVFALIYFRNLNKTHRRLLILPNILNSTICTAVLFINPNSFINSIETNILNHVDLIPLTISFVYCAALIVTVFFLTPVTPNRVVERNFLIMFLVSITISGFLKFFYSSHFTLWTTITICSMTYFLLLTSEKLLFDNLTKTYTRTVFEKDIAKIKPKQEFTVTLIDVNDLKKTNDELGHLYGDLAIKTITTEIYKNINKRDRFYRYGGDEFILLSNIETPQSMNEKLNNALESCKAMEGFPVSFAHASVIHKAKEDILITIQTVDDLMYDQKKAMKVGRI